MHANRYLMQALKSFCLQLANRQCPLAAGNRLPFRRRSITYDGHEAKLDAILGGRPRPQWYCWTHNLDGTTTFVGFDGE